MSTGAALALSVLPQARMRNIKTVYIESATRCSAGLHQESVTVLTTE